MPQAVVEHRLAEEASSSGYEKALLSKRSLAIKAIEASHHGGTHAALHLAVRIHDINSPTVLTTSSDASP